MGNRYEIKKLKCAYCGFENEDIYYAPTCGILTFKCKKCGKVNFIKEIIGFKAMKIEDVQKDDVEFAFLNNTNVIWDDKEVDKIIKEMYERLKQK